MMKQYMDIKRNYSDAILLFRLGDFYEAFFEDAKIISKVLNIVLTRRQDAPMAGIPHHALDNYLKKLIDSGYKVAICEQMEDPSQAKGIVRREVTRVITPGTLIEDEMLSQDNNYLMTVDNAEETFQTVLVDVSTGEVLIKTFEKIEDLIDFVKVSSVSQILSKPEIAEFIKDKLPKIFIEKLDDWYFEDAKEKIKETYDVISLEHMELGEAVKVLGATLKYLEYTLMSSIKLSMPKFLTENKWMILDSRTVENLSLVPGERGKNLYDILNKTKTSMGARTLKKWILQPLKDLEEIHLRQKAVEAFYADRILMNEVREYLNGVFDLERIATRLSYRKATPKDLVSLKNTLEIIPEIISALKTNEVLEPISDELNDFPELRELIDKAIKDEPSAAPGDGNVIKEGYSMELDEYRSLLLHSKEKMEEFARRERERTGIQKLKVGYNQVFGYYIEVPKGQVNFVPDYYTRRQTLVNSERYITPELKEFEDKILSAKEKIEVIEKKLFEELCEKVSEYLDNIKRVAKILSEIDVLSTFAYDAHVYGYVKPEFSKDKLVIKNGRHAVVERFLSEFVPNDTYMDRNIRMYIITGPNMSGKSTYIRQVGLIAVMAQMGSYVPAEYATLPVFDRIFTRMGARDDISTGKSTFLVEMSEVALILSKATENSLVLLDEVGRGTSTFDGISIAWAMSEYIYSDLKCKTMFATHFTELTELADVYNGIRNLTIEVEETRSGVVFVHKVVEGVADKSYGVEVAAIAGVPEGVVERAREILDIIVEKSDLEKKIRIVKEGQLKKIKRKRKIPEGQIKLFEMRGGNFD
ncbi:DNA mismatch repair protein MutS [Thermosipho ferrireducens]|uniref:DNA mismatch repair protein MutS n=1 Tax=Thermosipho ferrireducens TaxID=2571116 RepID=A0ABX7SAR7_9BACT|nr:DNA mismatch repair protein MutS [Thermosipho ferrireducens]QTA38882.1 DNA mismatch repair protein MutS [Thermosipho ferrireducens]